MSTSSNCPRYAPEDPALPKPWRGLIDGKTGYLYFWNPETNVTQYERPVAKQSAEQLPPPPPLKSSMVPVSSSVHSQHSSGTSRHGQYRDSREDDFRDAGSRGHHHHQRGGSGLLPQSQPNGVTSGGHGRSSSGLSVEMYRRQQEITVLGDDVPAPFMTFESAGFTPEMMREVHHAGFVEPTPIQAQAWPIVMQSRDIVAIAKTGSGKTLGYLFPGFMHLNRVRNSPKGGPTVLVLAPTRELATQILDEASKFGRSSRISSTCLYGGAPKGPQLRDLDRGVDVVVATPGRLNDILEMRRVSLKQVSYLVLDEADRMLDMGFEPQIRKIVKEIPPRRQTLMFTATWPKEVRKIAADLLVKPAQVNIGSIDVLVANKSITQYVELITPIEKQRRLEQILRSQEPGSKILIFCSTKRMCDQLSRSLSRQFGASAIHGDKSQNERDYVLGQFRSGRSPILVATDVAARGLDIKDVRVVINYDFPTGIEDYVHRIGRTGRAGATGLAYTFFSEQDSKHALDLVKVLEGAGQRVPREIRDMSSRGGGGRGKFRRWASGSGGRSRDSRNDAGYGARSDTGYGGRSDTTYGGRSDTTYGGRSDTTYAGRSDTTTYGGRSDSTTYGARSDTTSYGGRSDTTYGGRSDITHSGRSDVTYSGRSDIGYGGRSERGMQDDGTRGRGVDRDRSDRDRGDTRIGRDTKSTRDRERDVGHGRSHSPITRSRAGVSSRHSRSRSRSRDRGRSPLRRSRSRSRSHSRGRQGTGRQSGSRDHARSPARRSCSPARRSRSPTRRSHSPARRSHSPARRSRSPARRSRSRSRGHQVAARRSRSRSRGRGRSPARRSRSRSRSHGHSQRHLGEVAKRDLSPKDAHMVPSGLSPADARITNTNGLLHAHCESQHSSPIKDEQEKPRSPTRHASTNDHLPTPMEDIPPSSYDRLPISIDEKPPEYGGDLPISMDEKPSEYGHSPTAVDEKPFGYGHSLSMDDKPSGYGHSPSMDDKPSGYGHSPSRDDKPSGYGHSPTSMDDKAPVYDHTPMPMDDKPSRYGRSPIPSDDQPTYDRRLPSSMDDKPSDNGRPSIPLDDQPEYDRSPISRENEPRSPSLPRENGWVEPAQLATQPQSVSTISRDFNDRHSGEMIIPRSVSNLADDEEEGLIPAEEEGMIPVDDEGMIPAEEEGMIPQAGMEV